jgi:xanthine dehydrogenase/oxidase
VTILRAGDAETAMKTAPRRVTGSFSASGQNHFYLETQSSVASLVNGDVLEITCGTQDLTTFQNQIISVLKMNASQVQVKCQRTGGGFGGKLTGGIIEAISCGLAACLVKRPVRLFNSRTSDMFLHSGREAYSVEYEVGYDDEGKILAVIYELYCDAGCAYQDTLGSVTMAMRWADNAYHLPNYLARVTLCYTNTPPRTYARAPGLVQSCLATSVLIDRIATELRLKNSMIIQSRNFFETGNTTITGQPIGDTSNLYRCWETLLRRSRYSERFLEIEKWNEKNLWRKRGIAIEPMKYGIGYAFYNAGCEIGIFKSDGTVTVCHNGIEMGQGINTKVAQVISSALGVDLSFIRVTTSSTTRVANGGTTGGSGTSEVCCRAALIACEILNTRLLPFRQQSSAPSSTPPSSSSSWLELLSQLPPDISLNATGWYSPESNPNQEEFQYYVWGACVSEISYDVLTGMAHVVSSEIIYDCGLSLNPYVDLGQIEGAFVMGLGYLLQERVDYDDNGMLESLGSWEYKPPLAQDIPSIFNVTLLSAAPNKAGILRSKAVGEPAIVLANSLYFATKMAIQSCRVDAGAPEYFSVDAPLTIDIRQQASLVSPSRFLMPL